MEQEKEIVVSRLSNQRKKAKLEPTEPEVKESKLDKFKHPKAAPFARTPAKFDAPDSDAEEEPEEYEPITTSRFFAQYKHLVPVQTPKPPKQPRKSKEIKDAPEAEESQADQEARRKAAALRHQREMHQKKIEEAKKVDLGRTINPGYQPASGIGEETVARFRYYADARVLFELPYTMFGKKELVEFVFDERGVFFRHISPCYSLIYLFNAAPASFAEYSGGNHRVVVNCFNVLKLLMSMSGVGEFTMTYSERNPNRLEFSAKQGDCKEVSVAYNLCQFPAGDPKMAGKLLRDTRNNDKDFEAVWGQRDFFDYGMLEDHVASMGISAEEMKDVVGKLVKTGTETFSFYANADGDALNLIIDKTEASMLSMVYEFTADGAYNIELSPQIRDHTFCPFRSSLLIKIKKVFDYCDWVILRFLKTGDLFLHCLFPDAKEAGYIISAMEKPKKEDEKKKEAEQ